MLFENPIFQTINFGTHTSLHPLYPYVARVYGPNLHVVNHRVENLVHSLNLHQLPISIQFTPNHVMTVAADPSGSASQQLSAIDWETKEYIGKIVPTINDPRVLKTKNLMYMCEYSSVPETCTQFKRIWVLQNYTLTKKVGDHT